MRPAISRTRDSLEVRLEALRVLGAELAADTCRGCGRPSVRRESRSPTKQEGAARTAGAADDHRAAEVAAGRVVEHASIVRDLREGEKQEAHVHALHDRAEPRHGSADAHPLEGKTMNAPGGQSRENSGCTVTLRDSLLTMKLYSQIGVSRRRNSPYFLYRSYVTCGCARQLSRWARAS